MLRPGAIVLTRSAAKSLFSDSGSETKISSPGPWTLANGPPSSARQCSMNAPGRTRKRRVWTAFGNGTRGG